MDLLLRNWSALLYDEAYLHSGRSQGNELRSSGAYMTKALKLYGANPVGMPIFKLTMSLEKKVIDGMLTPYSAVIDFMLLDLVKYIADVDLYTMPMDVVMNKQKWNNLPDPAKKAIDEACAMQCGLHAAQVYNNQDQNMLNQNKVSGKIAIHKVPMSENKKFMESTKVMEMGFDPIWFGIIITLTMEMSLITPSVGINVFVISVVTKDVPMYTIFRGTLPFWFAMLACIILLVISPHIAFFLPTSMG